VEPRSSARIGVRELTIAVIAIAAVSAFLSFRGVYEPDLWWHLAQGREDAEGRLVRTNVFSFNYPDYRQQYTSWLFDVAVYLAWTAGRDAGVQCLQAVIIALTLWLIYAACRRRAGPAATAAVMTVGVFVLEPRAIPRPHLVSFLGMAACALAIERALGARSPRPLVGLIILIAIWSNFHVESVFGVALLACFAAGEFIRPTTLSRRAALRAAAVTAACGAALLANPYGLGILRYLYENASVPQMINIAELRPPYLPGYRAFFLYSALAGALVLGSRRVRVWEAIAIVVFGAAGFRFLRLTPLVFIVSAPMLAGRLGQWIPRVLDGRAVVLTTLAAAPLISRVPLTAYVHEWRIGQGALSSEAMFSTRAVSFAREAGLSGPVFNSFNLGGYLAWSFYPSARTFQDSRLQAWPPEHLPAIMSASESQAEWNVLVRPVDWAVLSRPSPNQLSGAGRFPRDAWATVFWDDAMEILVRRTGEHGRLAERYEYRLLTPEADPFDLAERLWTADGARLRLEVRRQLTADPGNLSALVIACADTDDDACTRLEGLAASRPAFQPFLDRARRLQR
jgi:hypothetical protein